MAGRRTQPGPGSAQAPLSRFDSVLALLETLRTEMDLGVDQVLAVQQLLALLAARGEEVSHGELKQYIGPLLCRSAAEQALFAERFDAWMAKPSGPGSRRPDAPTQAHQSKGLARGVRKRQRYLWLVGVLAFVGLVAGALWPAQPAPPATPADPQSEQPQAPTGPATPLPATTAPAKAERLRLRTSVIREQTAPPSRDGLVLLLGLLLAIALVFAAVGRRLRLWLEARRFLTRDPEAAQAELHKVQVAPGGELLRLPGGRGLSAVLRRREPLGLRELDVPASVAATARAGGHLTPVERELRRLPDYLAFIERGSRHDLLAALYDDWFAQLQREDLSVDRYYFDHSPYYLAHSDARAGHVQLGALQSTAGGHRLILCSEPGALMDRVSGEPQAWVEELAGFARRVLVNPEPQAHWGMREDQLMRAGMPIVPATASGLASTRGVQLPDAAGHDDLDADVPPLPHALSEQARQWLRQDAPEPDDLMALLGHLRGYLGAGGYDWLAACALYPQVRLPLAVALGELLSDAEGHPLATRARLMRLVRLPWMRAAFMPDWLRGALLESLPRERLREVRRALKRVLLSRGDGALILELGDLEEGLLSEMWRLARRRLRRNAPPQAAVRDPVLLRYMDDGFGVRNPFKRDKPATRVKEVRADEGPPHWLASTAGAATLAWATLLACAAMGALHASLGEPIWFGAIASGLSLGLWTWAVMAVVTRWLRPAYAGLRFRTLRMAADASVLVFYWAAGENGQGTNGALVFMPDMQATAMVVLALVAGLAAWGWRGGRLRAPIRQRLTLAWPALLRGLTNGLMVARAGLVRSAESLDRRLPDRTRWGRYRATRSGYPSPLATGAMAVLAAPCTAGYGVGVYASLLAWRYGTIGVGPARAGFEVVLAYACMFALGLDRELELWAWGPLLAPALYFTAQRVARRARRVPARLERYLSAGGRLLGLWRRTGVLWLLYVLAYFLRAQPPGGLGRFLDRAAPDRWWGIRPIHIPAFLGVMLFGSAITAVEGTPLEHRIAIAPYLPGWPSERVVVERVTLPTVASRVLAFSPDGGRVLLAQGDDEKAPVVVALDPAREGFKRRVLGQPGAPAADVAFRADGTMVLLRTGSPGFLNVYGADGELQASSELERVDNGWLRPDGREALLLTGEGELVLMATGQASIPRERFRQRLRYYPAQVTQVAFGGPDSVAYALGGLAGPFQLEHWREGKKAFSTYLEDYAFDLAVGANGQTACALGAAGVALFDADGVRLKLPDHEGPGVWKVAFSPDGSLLAGAGGGSTVIWELAEPGVRRVLGPSPPALSVAFSPDGTRLVTGHEDGAAQIREADGSGQAVVLRSPPAGPVTAFFDPVGARVLTLIAGRFPAVYQPFDFPRPSPSAEPAPVQVLVYTNMEGAQLRIDGEPRGPLTPGAPRALSLPPGAYLFEADSGGETVGEPVTVREGSPLDVYLNRPYLNRPDAPPPQPQQQQAPRDDLGAEPTTSPAASDSLPAPYDGRYRILRAPGKPARGPATK